MRGDKTSRPRPRVVLADEEGLLREAVCAVLTEQAAVHVVATVASARQVTHVLGQTRPDVLVISAAAAGAPRIEGLSAVIARHDDPDPGVRVVLILDDEDVGLTVRALEIGVRAVVTRHAPLRVLVNAVQPAAEGRLILPPGLLEPVLGEVLGRARERDRLLRRIMRLTARQREVLMLLADGQDTVSIAEALTISPATARTHVQHLLEILGLHSRLEAVTQVLAHDLRDALDQSLPAHRSRCR